MATVTFPQLPASQLPTDWTLADLQRHFGGIPLQRIRLVPPPGYGTENDVIEIEARENRLCELENGVLVEKPMGWYESLIAPRRRPALNTAIREVCKRTISRSRRPISPEPSTT